MSLIENTLHALDEGTSAKLNECTRKNKDTTEKRQTSSGTSLTNA